MKYRRTEKVECNKKGCGPIYIGKGNAKFIGINTGKYFSNHKWLIAPHCVIALYSLKTGKKYKEICSVCDVEEP